MNAHAECGSRQDLAEFRLLHFPYRHPQLLFVVARSGSLGLLFRRIILHTHTVTRTSSTVGSDGGALTFQSMHLPRSWKLAQLFSARRSIFNAIFFRSYARATESFKKRC